MARRHDTGTGTGETLDEIQSGVDRLGAYLQEHLREVVIADCGHMVQHDQPARLAGVLDDFFCARD